MWTLYNSAKTWGSRPSELLGITETYQAYCLDQAVAMFGNYVENRLANVDDKDPKKAEKKREALLESILTGKPGKRFAEPPKHNVSRGVRV
jgi:hypothetical protein